MTDRLEEQTKSRIKKASLNLGVKPEELLREFNVTSRDFWRIFVHFSTERELPALRVLFKDVRNYRLQARKRGESLSRQWTLVDAKRVKARIEVENRRTPVSPIIGQSSDHTKPIHIVWCGIPVAEDIGLSLHERIPFCSQVNGIFHETAVKGLLLTSELSSLSKELGPSFISKSQGEIFIHQDVMTMLKVQETNLASVEFRTAKWMAEKIKSKTLTEHLKHLESSRVVVFASFHGLWKQCPLDMTQFYAYMARVASSHGNLRLYPNQIETTFANLKTNDIRALDIIASNSKEAFAYRPRTCFGEGDCTISDLPLNKTVLKRSCSFGGEHVILNPKKETKMLQCRRPQSRSKPRQNQQADAENSLDLLWHHQERVPSLTQFGEFRVYICQRQVINIILTRWHKGKPGAELAARPIKDSDFSWYSQDEHEQRLKKEELKSFALHVNSELLNMPDSERWESLRVGVRLDCGVSELSREGRFFCLEVSRYTYANQMAECTIAFPHLLYAEKYGAALADELHRDQFPKTNNR